MKDMKLIIFPTGSLKPDERKRLSRHGFVAIECDDPSKIVMPDFTPMVQTKDVLLAVADSLASGNMGMESRAFQYLMKRIQKNLSEPTKP